MKVTTNDGLEIEGNVNEVSDLLRAMRYGLVQPEPKKVIMAPQKPIKVKKPVELKGKNQVLWKKIFGRPVSYIIKEMMKEGRSKDEIINTLSRQAKQKGLEMAMPRIKNRLKTYYNIISSKNRHKKPESNFTNEDIAKEPITTQGDNDAVMPVL